MTPEDIKQLRLDMGLTQMQLAERSGFSVYSIHSMETGRRKISERAKKIFKMIKLSFDISLN